MRVQWMRADMTAWGEGPAAVYDLAGAIDKQGKVTAIQLRHELFLAPK